MSVSVREVTFRTGENITLYCDCKTATGVFIAWFFRYCSHENQSHHVITISDQFKLNYKFPRLKFIKNESSESYDLLVINATNADEGFYYCGTAELRVEKDKDKNIFSKEIYLYGDITTRLKLSKQIFLSMVFLMCLNAVHLNITNYLCLFKIPVRLVLTLRRQWRTAAGAGSCSSFCARLFFFSLFSSPHFYFTCIATKQVLQYWPVLLL